MSFGSCSPEEEVGGQLQKDTIVRLASIREGVKTFNPFWCRVPPAPLSAGGRGGGDLCPNVTFQQ